MYCVGDFNILYTYNIGGELADSEISKYSLGEAIGLSVPRYFLFGDIFEGRLLKSPLSLRTRYNDDDVNEMRWSLTKRNIFNPR